jgi:DHA1 family multidrug resistance protein-like MFS transporter
MKEKIENAIGLVYTVVEALCRLVLILSGYYALWVQVMLIFPILVKQMAGSTTAVGWMYTL